MCDPATAALVIATASAAAAVAQQNKVADAQSKTNQQTYDGQMTAYNFNLANANNRKITEAGDAASRKFDTTIKSQDDLARARTASGESGISGLSVEALLADLSSAAGRANVNTEVNYLRRDSALEVDKMNMWSGAANSINSLKTPMGADYIGAGLKIADAGATYSDKYKQGKTVFNKE